MKHYLASPLMILLDFTLVGFSDKFFGTYRYSENLFQDSQQQPLSHCISQHECL